MSKTDNIVRVFDKFKRRTVWHWVDQMQASERGKWRTMCGVRMHVLSMATDGIEYVHGCARCDAAHRRLPTTK